MNAVTVQDPKPLATWSPDQLDLIKRTIAKDATNDELKLFLYQCERTGLDPLTKQIYFQKRAGRVVIITSIDGYRLVAARTGQHAGTDDAVLDNEKEPNKASVTVYRMINGVKSAFTASARWSEYCPPKGQDHMWIKMPCTMLSKVAESLALRKAFPNDLGGVYTKEEMDQSPAPEDFDQRPAYSPPVIQQTSPPVEPIVMPQAQPKSVAHGSGAFCAACGLELIKSKAGTGFFCPDFKNATKGEHTRFAVDNLEAYKLECAEKAASIEKEFDQHNLK